MPIPKLHCNTEKPSMAAPTETSLFMTIRPLRLLTSRHFNLLHYALFSVVVVFVVVVAVVLFIRLLVGNGSPANPGRANLARI